MIARHDPAHDVELPRHAHHLEHLANLRQAGAGLIELRLRHLDVHERAQRIAERGRIEARGPRREHAARLEFVEPGLRGAARHPEAARELAYADAGVVHDDLEEPSVGVVQVGCGVHVPRVDDDNVGIMFSLYSQTPHVLYRLPGYPLTT